MARRVADLRAAFEVMAGPTWRDPWTVPAPLRGPEPAKPIRVALVARPGRSGHRGAGAGRRTQRRPRRSQAAGYAVDEVEPPSIDAAATRLVVMLNTAEIRAVWQQVVPPSLPADTQRFMSAFYEAAGDPDPVATVQSFMTRQSLLRAWGEFQETTR